MKDQFTYKNLKTVDEQSKRFFKGGKFQWKNSDSEIWDRLQMKIDKPQPKVIHLFPVAKWIAAAVIILSFTAVSFSMLYTKNIQTASAEHTTIVLPDGSQIDLNAKSDISYHPFLWFFKRDIRFEGEAYFTVTKGRPFTVKSQNAITQVLGTQFNVFSRDNVYRVVCIEGSVKVISHIGDEEILKPNDKVIVQPGGSLILSKNVELTPEISWKNFTFFFTATPLRDVFGEIERQYGVVIDTKQVDLRASYTGNFNKNQNVEDILGYICPAMGFRFIQQSKNLYTVIPDQQ